MRPGRYSAPVDLQDKMIRDRTPGASPHDMETLSQHISPRKCGHPPLTTGESAHDDMATVMCVTESRRTLPPWFAAPGREMGRVPVGTSTEGSAARWTGYCPQ